MCVHIVSVRGACVDAADCHGKELRRSQPRLQRPSCACVVAALPRSQGDEAGQSPKPLQGPGRWCG